MFKVWWVRLVAVLLAYSAGLVAQAKVTIDTTTNYYIVDGRTAQDIRANMNEVRSGKFDAYTKWNIKWRYFYKEAKTSCAISTLDVDVLITYTMPQLATDTSANAAALKRWNSYYPALVKHERGHRELAIQAGLAVEQALLDMGSRRTCDILKEDVDDIAQSIVKSYGTKQVNYDEKTNHGMKTGASFP